MKTTKNVGDSTTADDDIQRLPWAAEQLHINPSTAYRLARKGQLPGCFKLGGAYRISVTRFWREVRGEATR